MKWSLGLACCSSYFTGHVSALHFCEPLQMMCFLCFSILCRLKIQRASAWDIVSSVEIKPNQIISEGFFFLYAYVCWASSFIKMLLSETRRQGAEWHAGFGFNWDVANCPADGSTDHARITTLSALQLNYMLIHSDDCRWVEIMATVFYYSYCYSLF